MAELKISVIDLDIFKDIINEVITILKDDRVPEDIKEHIYETLKEHGIEREYKID